jgi:hypothetical protein
MVVSFLPFSISGTSTSVDSRLSHLLENWLYYDNLYHYKVNRIIENTISATFNTEHVLWLFIRTKISTHLREKKVIYKGTRQEMVPRRLEEDYTRDDITSMGVQSKTSFLLLFSFAFSSITINDIYLSFVSQKCLHRLDT